MVPEQDGHILYAILITVALGLSILSAGRAYCTVARPSDGFCSLASVGTAVNSRLTTWQR
jgi:hypothetical protein